MGICHGTPSNVFYFILFTEIFCFPFQVLYKTVKLYNNICQMSVFSFRSKSVSDTVQQYLSDECIFFQIKKCQSDTYGYCVINPPRLPEGLFEELHFVPDPVPGADGVTYKNFHEVYGTNTTDEARPSLLDAEPSLCEINSLRTYLLLVSLCFDLAFVSVHVLSNECAKWDKLRYLKYFII